MTNGRKSVVSRVLFPFGFEAKGGRLSIWDACYQTPRAVRFNAEPGKDQPWFL
ncbi:MAG: hypothetical protein Fur0025_00770 [Oscillatoriaceae cyanobacterium]